MRNLCILCMVFIGLHSLGQTPATSYPFIHTDINRIENDSNYLEPFYRKLYTLKTQHEGVINIVQIGDSHIQGDALSGAVRTNLQENFGNAGRGLIFPYRVAKTNGPEGLSSSSNAIWSAKRNVFVNNPLPIGVCGITIETKTPGPYITETVANTSELNYGFNEVTLFYEHGPGFADFTLSGDSDNILFKAEPTQDPNIVRFTGDAMAHQLILRADPPDSGQELTSRIFGMMLSNDSNGIRYHMIGVNGAEYKHYLASAYFADQLPALEPDLIIVSMGTNEAMNGHFDSATFYQEIQQTISSWQSKVPDARFILTTPPDSYRWINRKPYKNPNTRLAAQTIIRYCQENHLAYWDLNGVMGGYGSMGPWARAGLTARDYVHFQPKGYRIQGNLLYNALIRNYEYYTEH